MPLMVRITARERQVQSLRDEELPDQAETALRKALAAETTEVGRFRYGATLAEVLAEDRDDRAGGIKVLTELLPSLKRGDLVHQLNQKLKDFENQPKDQDQGQGHGSREP